MFGPNANSFLPQLDEGTPPEPEGSFVDYQTTMVKFSKAVAVTAQEMVGETLSRRESSPHPFLSPVTVATCAPPRPRRR